MRKLFKNKYALLIICAILCLSIAMVYTFSGSVNTSQKIRDINLNSKQVDVQSILNEFSDVDMDKNNERILFEGTRKLDASLLKEIDNLSADDVNKLKTIDVRYSFKYDMVNNIVTLKATMNMPDGTVKIDTITGVGFINDANEIDAVMNVDGEGILLSEMRNAGLIDNVGWFSRIIKKVAKVVAVAAVVVAAVAVVVATAGVAAPAVVAAGIGVTSTVVASTSLAIAGYSAATAAVAAGVYVAADRTENFEWQGTTYKFKALTKEEIRRLEYKDVFLAVIGKDDRVYISPFILTDREVVVAARSGCYFYCVSKTRANSVAKKANREYWPKLHETDKKGYYDHYHIYKVNDTSHFFFGLPKG